MIGIKVYKYSNVMQSISKDSFTSNDEKSVFPL